MLFPQGAQWATLGWAAFAERSSIMRLATSTRPVTRNAPGSRIIINIRVSGGSTRISMNLKAGPSSSEASENRVPEPVISRIAPMKVSARVKPAPMKKPSANEGSMGFFEATISMRANGRQLTTISGMNRPSTLYSSCSHAFMHISTTVTMVARISTNTGMRTSWEKLLRNMDATAAEPVITKAVASPMPRPLVALLVMAIAGHRPSIMLSTPLFDHNPSRAMVRYSAIVVISVCLLRWSLAGSSFRCFHLIALEFHYLCLVGIEELQTFANRANHCARRDGSAGELVKLATVFLHLPFVERRITDTQAGETQYPIALLHFDLVAQAGGFPVCQNACTKDRKSTRLN